MGLVAGVDSSTQSCKIVIRDADTGALARRGQAPHPMGTEVDPEAWWESLLAAVADAGGLTGVEALSVGAQQHGMVLLDDDGAVVRPALLWNDTRSAPQAADLVRELGPAAWAQAVGSVPVASFTVTKLRWVAEHEPEAVRRTRTVCLPHDWLTWRVAGAPDGGPVTDRGDASGTGYWSPAAGAYRLDLLERAFGAVPAVPDVLDAGGRAGTARHDLLGRDRDLLLAAGTGDNMAAALGLALEPGDVVVSIGTSGTAFARCPSPTADPTGLVAGFADATGGFLPLACTLNAARVLDAGARLLGVDHDDLDRLALAAPPGSGGVVLVPYLDGERTPNRPHATGMLVGLTTTSSTRENLARAFVEGLLCGLADAVDALAATGVGVGRVLLVGGGSRSEAVRRIAPAVLGRPVVVPEPGEYVADGAARQAAWALRGAPPDWAPSPATLREADAVPAVREAYALARG